jgi:uncharacterized protein with GYD domain
MGRPRRPGPSDFLASISVEGVSRDRFVTPEQLSRGWQMMYDWRLRGGYPMPKFLIEGSYSAEGLRGLAKDKASGRQAAVKDALASLGGKLEGVYYALGDADVYVLCECPDHVS